MSNRLQFETSPYLLQHKDNPVDWYPWGEEAFEKAKAEDKPIFLSIGYSSCHWCHVLAHESFEDVGIAEILNRHFVSVKVDREERPDIDSVYMAVCQAFTGSGGWPTSIFMTADQMPFFAGTYFPKNSRGGMIGMYELLSVISDMWENERDTLLKQSDDIMTYLQSSNTMTSSADESLVHSAAELYKQLYDEKYGGFGRAPKFPTPHNIMFLLSYYERYHDEECLEMAEYTLQQMHRGGLFDHIGYGFCRYSTDKLFLVPHFEKMLYDNALLIIAYSKAYAVTKKTLYVEIAQKTAEYVLREMTSDEGGFYSAQDADSEGEEGRYYLFTPNEIVDVLGGKTAVGFSRHFDIKEQGNFEGKSIPNLLKSAPTNEFDEYLSQLREYRKHRYALSTDDKVLTFWNSLMIVALCELYAVSGKTIYLDTAKNADGFIQKKLFKNGKLYVSFRDGKRGVRAFLDDYAGYIFAQLALYRATSDSEYLKRANDMCCTVIADFSDDEGGFFLYSNDSEELISRPKETYDGAIPSGNSLMAYNLVRLSQINGDENLQSIAEKQLDFLAAEASHYPAGYAMFLLSLLDHIDPPTKIIVVLNGQTDRKSLLKTLPHDYLVIIYEKPTKEYPLKNGKTTYYVCKGHSCLPPINELSV